MLGYRYKNSEFEDTGFLPWGSPPDENWLPINRGDYDVDIIMRLYAPDLEKFARWSPPAARKLK